MMTPQGTTSVSTADVLGTGRVVVFEVPGAFTTVCTHDGQSMSVIASFSLLSAPTLTKLIDRMVAANLVYRRGDEKDRRRVLVHLAPRGRALFRGLQGPAQDEQARRDAAVTGVVDPAELSQLLADVLAQLD